MMKEYCGNKRGQTLVEFALVLPIFLLFVLAICQFGLIFFTYLTANEVAREGARLTVVGNSYSTVKTKVATNFKIAESAITFVPTDDTTLTVGSDVKVTVTMAKPLELPLISNFIPDEVYNNIISTVYMRVEKIPGS